MKPILKWQYDQIIKELLLLQEHQADPSCPCESDSEMCVRKHLLTIEAYAQETIPIEDDETHKDKLEELAGQAQELRASEEKRLCGHTVELPVDIVQWSRDWRKQFESYSLACQLKGGNPMDDKRIYRQRYAATDILVPKRGDVLVNKNGDEWEVTKVGHGYYELMYEDGDTIQYTMPEMERDLKEGWWHYKDNPVPKGVETEKYDRCVADVQNKIDKGQLVEGSNPYAICAASLKEHSPSLYDVYVAIAAVAAKNELAHDWQPEDNLVVIKHLLPSKVNPIISDIRSKVTKLNTFSLDFDYDEHDFILTVTYREASLTH